MRAPELLRRVARGGGVQRVVSGNELGALALQPWQEQLAHAGSQVQEEDEIDTAPAARQAPTTASSCSGASEMPGSTGATSTPHSMPASLSRRTVSTRWRGGGVPGSVVRHACSSSVPIDRLTRTDVRRDASASTSMSRRIIVDLVRIENEFLASESAEINPRVSR